MKFFIEIKRDTVCDGEDVCAGQIISTSEKNSKMLIALDKAVSCEEPVEVKEDVEAVEAEKTDSKSTKKTKGK